VSMHTHHHIPAKFRISNFEFRNSKCRLHLLVALRTTLSALLLAGLLVGCGGERAATTQDGRTPVEVFLMFISVKQAEFYQWAEQTFEARNPDIDIQVQQFPGSSLKDYEIKLRLRFSSGKPPDVMGMHENVAASFARLGLLAPAPPAIERMVQANSLNEMIRKAPYIDGACYGIVSDAAWQALYYNKDHFREVGLDPEHPPETWDELLDYAERLTIRDEAGDPVRTGFFVRKTGFKPGIAEKWFTFLYSAGGQPFNEDGTAARFNSPEGREALELYDTLLFEKNIDSIELEGDQQGFGQERVSMFLREVHVIRWLHEHYPDIDFGVAPVPKKEASISSGGPYLFVVAEDSPHKDAAWRFIQFLMEDEAYAKYAAIGGVLPVTASVAALPKYRDDPMLQVFLNQRVAAPPAFPRVDRATDILGAYIERFCYGLMGIDETLERAERDVNAVLIRNRRRNEQAYAE